MSIKDLKFNGVIKEADMDKHYKIAQFIPHLDVIQDEEFCFDLPKREIILNQGGFGACVGHAVALGLSVLEYQLTGKWIDYDPFGIYGTRFPEDDYYGIGMYSAQGVKAVHRNGAFLRRDFGLEAEMPQIQKLVEEFMRQNPELCEEARARGIEGYGTVRGVRQIQNALKHGMVVTCAWDLYDSFWETDDDGKVPMPSGDYIGAHQMLIVGWTRNRQWIVANSWGEDCGLKGIYLIPYEYEPFSAIAMSNTITPSKKKAKEIQLTIDAPLIVVDGEVKGIDAVPVIVDSRTFVPARFVAEHLGASVEWIGEGQRVIIRSEEAEIQMQIGWRGMLVNGREHKNDVAPFIANDRTMVPARVIAENLNSEVLWDGENRIVTIKAL